MPRSYRRTRTWGAQLSGLRSLPPTLEGVGTRKRTEQLSVLIPLCTQPEHAAGPGALASGRNPLDFDSAAPRVWRAFVEHGLLCAAAVCQGHACASRT